MAATGTLGLGGVSSGGIDTLRASVPAAQPEDPHGGEKDLSHEHHAKDYSLELQTAGVARLGVPMEVELNLAAKNGKKVNLDYPIKVTAVDPVKWQIPAGNPKISKGERPEAATIFSSAKPLLKGKQALEVRVAFSVCSDEQCLMEKVVLSDTISVE